MNYTAHIIGAENFNYIDDFLETKILSYDFPRQEMKYSQKPRCPPSCPASPLTTPHQNQDFTLSSSLICFSLVFVFACLFCFSLIFIRYFDYIFSSYSSQIIPTQHLALSSYLSKKQKKNTNLKKKKNSKIKIQTYKKKKQKAQKSMKFSLCWLFQSIGTTLKCG